MGTTCGVWDVKAALQFALKTTATFPNCVWKSFIMSDINNLKIRTVDHILSYADKHSKGTPTEVTDEIDMVCSTAHGYLQQLCL